MTTNSISGSVDVPERPVDKALRDEQRRAARRMALQKHKEKTAVQTPETPQAVRERLASKIHTPPVEAAKRRQELTQTEQKKRGFTGDEAKNMAIGMIPVAGTIQSAKNVKANWATSSTKDKIFGVGLTGLSALGDVLILAGGAGLLLKAANVGGKVGGGVAKTTIVVTKPTEVKKIISQVKTTGGNVEEIVIGSRTKPSDVAKLVTDLGKGTPKKVTLEMTPDIKSLSQIVKTDDALKSLDIQGLNAVIVVDKPLSKGLAKTLATAAHSQGINKITVRTVLRVVPKTSVKEHAQLLANISKGRGDKKFLDDWIKRLEKQHKTLNKDATKGGNTLAQELGDSGISVVRQTETVGGKIKGSGARVVKLDGEGNIPGTPVSTIKTPKGGGPPTKTVTKSTPSTKATTVGTTVVKTTPTPKPVFLSPGWVLRHELTDTGPVPVISPVDETPTRVINEIKQNIVTQATDVAVPKHVTQTQVENTAKQVVKELDDTVIQNQPDIVKEIVKNVITEMPPEDVSSTTTTTEVVKKVVDEIDKIVEVEKERTSDSPAIPTVKPEEIKKIVTTVTDKPLLRPSSPVTVSKTITRPSTKPQTQTQAQLKPASRVATAQKTLSRTRPAKPTRPVGTGVALPPFVLPSGGLPSGQYPQTVSWSQGFVKVKLNLDSGARSYTALKTAVSRTPAETFKVLTTDTTPPRTRTFRQGIVGVVVSPTGLRFTKVARQRASNPFRRTSRSRI